MDEHFGHFSNGSSREQIAEAIRLHEPEEELVTGRVINALRMVGMGFIFLYFYDKYPT